jgi:hypothetical protein
MLQTLAVPLIVAAVFTLGGYGITKAGRHADELSEFLGALFLIVALLAGVAELVQISTRGPSALPRSAILRASF